MRQILTAILLFTATSLLAQTYQFTLSGGTKRFFNTKYILFVREVSGGSEITSSAPSLTILRVLDTLGTVQAASCGTLLLATEEYKVGADLRTRRILVSRENIEKVDTLPGNKGLLTYRNPNSSITIRGFSTFKLELESCSGGGGATIAENGLTQSGDTIRLGGALTQNTHIDTDTLFAFGIGQINSFPAFGVGDNGFSVIKDKVEIYSSNLDDSVSTSILLKSDGDFDGLFISSYQGGLNDPFCQSYIVPGEISFEAYSFPNYAYIKGESSYMYMSAGMSPNTNCILQVNPDSVEIDTRSTNPKFDIFLDELNGDFETNVNIGEAFLIGMTGPNGEFRVDLSDGTALAMSDASDEVYLDIPGNTDWFVRDGNAEKVIEVEQSGGESTVYFRGIGVECRGPVFAVASHPDSAATFIVEDGIGNRNIRIRTDEISMEIEGNNGTPGDYLRSDGTNMYWDSLFDVTGLIVSTGKGAVSSSLEASGVRLTNSTPGTGETWNIGSDNDGKLGIYGGSATPSVAITPDNRVGLNVATPDSAAALEVNSTVGGLLLPRMTTTQRDAILTPPNGLIIYNTTTNKVQARAAGAWVDLH